MSWKAVTCKKCGDTIRSRYSGEYVTCKCGAISVDQTEWYTRYIGDYEDFIIPGDENNNNSGNTGTDSL